MKILIATMTCGEGHNAIARSAAAELEKKHEVKVVNIYSHLGKRDANNGAYLFFVRHFPCTYNFVWEIGRRLNAEKRYRGLAKSGIKCAEKELERITNEFQPDVVLCTHVYASNIFCWLKIHNRFHAKLYSIFFDYVNCPFWEGSVLCDGVFTPHEDVHLLLLGRGFRFEQLITTGFPVHPRFYGLPSKEELREKFGIPKDAFVVLSLNGGACIGNTKGLIKTLYRSRTGGKKLITLVVCGHNEKEKRRLERLCRKKSLNGVRVFGFVNNVQELMRASDLYFCRGGGGAVSEAMTCGVNFVVRERVTAQEIENKRFFRLRGLCFAMKRLKDARKILEENILHPEVGESMQARVQAFVRLNGVKNIAEYIDNL